MNTIIDTWNLTRAATDEEIEIYEKVKAILYNLSDEDFETVIEACSNHAFYGGDKSTYSRMYRQAKKYGIKPGDLMTWYYIED